MSRGDRGLTGLSRPRLRRRPRPEPAQLFLRGMPAGAATVLMLARQTSSGIPAMACAALRSRFRRRMYHPRAANMDSATKETLTDIPAFAPSESWSDGGRRASGMSDGILVGRVEVTLDDGRPEMDDFGDSEPGKVFCGGLLFTGLDADS